MDIGPLLIRIKYYGIDNPKCDVHVHACGRQDLMMMIMIIKPFTMTENITEC